MTKTTRDGNLITKEQFTALYIFHGIFGFHYYSICEEANNLDRDLLENPEFMKDIYSAIESLPEPCGKVMLERLGLKSYKDIAKMLGIRAIMVQEHEHTAWKLIRRPERTKNLRNYTEGFKKWEESVQETNDN